MLHAFTGYDGYYPTGLINVSGALYGTTSHDLSPFCSFNGCGTVFELKPPPVTGGAWTEQVLYDFRDVKVGYYPSEGLISVGGALYGTTNAGGLGCAYFEESGCGTVFALAPPGIRGAAWSDTVLHAFTGRSDGRYPEGGLISLNGKLYGTTGGYQGLHKACSELRGCGTVFELAPPVAGGAWTQTVLHAFTGGSDGDSPTGYPTGSLISVGDILYGTTSYGGTGCGGRGCGTVFEIAP